MAEVVKEVRLLQVNADSNNNKFYTVSLNSDGLVTKRWGRVGADGATSTENTGEYGFEKIVAAKKRRGYQETNVISSAASTSSQSISNEKLATIAGEALAADRDSKIVSELITRISRLNKHEILEASGGKIQVSTDGVVTTALGIVDERSIQEARQLLTRLNQPATGTIDKDLLNQYLTLIPQKVPYQRGWADEFLTQVTTPTQQFQLLDQLEDSVAWYRNQQRLGAQASNDTDDQVDYSDFFRYRIKETSAAEFKSISRQYEKTKNMGHSWAHLRPVRAFALLSNNADDEVKWNQARDELGNVQQLWHGTSSANLLSVFRRGIIIPGGPAGVRKGFDFHGAMFGTGIYLSNQSTKALGYSHGYWSGSRATNCFMFLTETVRGNEYTPTVRAYDRTIPQKARTEKDRDGRPFNSINIRPGYGGVRNHEAIVWNTEQVALRYLVEFDA